MNNHSVDYILAISWVWQIDNLLLWVFLHSVYYYTIKIVYVYKFAQRCMLSYMKILGNYFEVKDIFCTQRICEQQATINMTLCSQKTPNDCYRNVGYDNAPTYYYY